MSDDRYIYTAVSLKDDGPDRKNARWAVVDPNGKTIKVYAGSYAIADATNHAERANRRAGLGRQT